MKDLPKIDKGQFTPTDELYEHAQLSVLTSVQAELAHISEWAGAQIGKTPTEIFDLNGQPLFYDFEVSKGKQVLGYVRTAASQVLGAPVVATEIGERFWSLKKAVAELKDKVAAKFKGYTVKKPQLVCYGYPKIGVMFVLTKANAKDIVLVFDVASLKPVDLAKAESGADVAMDGPAVWSFYESLTPKNQKARLVQYDAHNKLKDKAKKDSKLKLGDAGMKIKAPAGVGVGGLVIKLSRSKTLQYCSHYRETETRSHHCFSLHGQQKDNYCAVATGQMNLCYFRYYYTQDQVAPAFKYSAGCPTDTSAGYMNLSYKHLVATFDGSPTWEKAKAEIDKLHPMKSGTPGHARACAGYSYTQLGPTVSEKKLYIYDPWPWNADYKLAGVIKWENWDSITHTNFIFLKIKTS